MKSCNIGIVGSSTLLGKAFRDCLEEIEIPRESVEFIASDREEKGQLTEFLNEPSLIQESVSKSFEGLDYLIVCEEKKNFRKFSELEKVDGIVTVFLGNSDIENSDNSAYFNALAGRVEEGKRHYYVTHPAVTLSQLILDPLMQYNIDYASIFGLQPASYFDEAGLEELHSQTVGLLNFEDVPEEVFGAQSSFNLIQTRSKERFGDLDGMLDSQMGYYEDYSAGISVIQVPIFYGYGCCISVKLDKEVDVENLGEAILDFNSRYIEKTRKESAVIDFDSERNQKLQLGKIWRDPNNKKHFWIWVVADGVKFCRAENAVKFLESNTGDES